MNLSFNLLWLNSNLLVCEEATYTCPSSLDRDSILPPSNTIKVTFALLGSPDQGSCVRRLALLDNTSDGVPYVHTHNISQIAPSKVVIMGPVASS